MLDNNIKENLKAIDDMVLMAEIMIVSQSEKEKILRMAISRLFSIFKKVKEKDTILKKMHEIGLIVNEDFGCKIPFKNNEYWQECPIKLAQIPFPLGVSIGALSAEVCSICGRDFLDCTHVKGNFYDNVVCKRIASLCNICLKESCQHEEGNSYNQVQAIGIMKDLKFDHIALVDNPLEPEAGIMSIAYDRKLISNMLLINGLKWGDELNCNYCLINKVN